MKFFFDGTTVSEIETWIRAGIVRGVTTNPAMLRKAGWSTASRELANLVATVRPFTVSIMPQGRAPEELISGALCLREELGDNVMPKIPVIDDQGNSLLPVIHDLATRQVCVNATACLSVGQAVLAGQAGAGVVSLLVGRHADEGGDPSELIGRVRAGLDGAGQPEVLAASVRTPGDVQQWMTARPDIMTVPGGVLTQMLSHQNSQRTVREFWDAARSR